MRALGIDIGTTTISMAIVDMSTECVEKSYTISNGSFIHSQDTWEKAQDPEVIISKTLELAAKVFAEFSDITVIGLTGQMHGIVYLDAEGNHVSPLYTWQDQRGDVAAFDGKSVCMLTQEITGLKVPTGYGLISHLYNMKKGLVSDQAVQVCTIMDYLGMKLTGRKKPLIHSSNAASIGFYNAPDGCFCTKELEMLEVDLSLLPEVTEDFELLGHYQGIPVGVAIGDNQASFLGSVKDASSSILINMGTGGQISVLADTYFTSKDIEARPFAKGKYLLAGSSLCGGRAYATLAGFFKLTASAMGITDLDPYKLMDQLLSHRQDTDELKITTTFSGTRAEPWRRGSIENLSEANFRPDALTFGVLDGMAEELYSMYHEIEDGIDISKTKMIASGNGLRKNQWLQDIMSRKFHMELQMAENAEEAATGAVFSGLIAAGKKTLKETIRC